jgi:hypothetical protein
MTGALPGRPCRAGPGTLPFVPAVIEFDFDPSASIFGLPVRLETLATAGVILLVLIMVALAAGRANAAAAEEAEGAMAAEEEAAFEAETPGWLGQGAEPRGLVLPGREISDPDSASRRPTLRRDDLILIAFGAVPGAVVGARLDYGLIHLDFYQANQLALFDPAQGSMGLTLGVLLGTLTALAVARLLAAPLGRWLSVASVPVLLGLGLGKLAMVLGGAGQGGYSDASWSTSYLGDGPWESANPSFSALPSQLVEGLLVLLAVVAILAVPVLLRLRLRRWHLLVRPGWSARRDWSMLRGGRRFLTMLGLWAIARFVAAFTWRDASVAGPLNVEQIELLVLMIVALPGPWLASVIGRGCVGVWRWLPGLGVRLRAMLERIKGAFARGRASVARRRTTVADTTAGTASESGAINVDDTRASQAPTFGDSAASEWNDARPT